MGRFLHFSEIPQGALTENDEDEDSDTDPDDEREPAVIREPDGDE